MTMTNPHNLKYGPLPPGCERLSDTPAGMTVRRRWARWASQHWPDERSYFDADRKPNMIPAGEWAGPQHWEIVNHQMVYDPPG